MSDSEFKPDWRSPPGDTIKDWMEERGISAHDLAVRCYMSEKEMLRLLSGELVLDFSIALKLATVLGATPDFWIQRERHYREPK